ncbi:MAG: bacterial transcriptional activator domain-containing protein [Proteobacteria bacterium]|nr:bacterial transcriptional activator domain-containing protein [Pseudomonadota bacterium]
MVFSFLVLNRERLVSRDALFSHFYPDLPESTARKRLRNAIWRIRSVVEPKGAKQGRYLSVRNRLVGFNADSDHWLDVDVYESRIASIQNGSRSRLTKEQAAVAGQAIDLYRGRLLEGYCEDWCLWHQERSKLQLLSTIEGLMQYFAARNDWPSAILNAQHLLSHDPLREHVYRDLMNYYYRIGDRPAALKQYETCALLLRTELGIEPMRETRALRNAIRAESALQALAPNPDERDARSFPEPLRRNIGPGLETGDGPATHTLDEVRSSLKQAMALVTQLIAHRQHRENPEP